MKNTLKRIVIGLVVLALFGVFSTSNISAQSASATVVNAYHLNVRTSVGISAGVVAVIDRGHSFPVIGRNAESTWWQIILQPSGIVGWASGAYLSVTNAHLVPIVTVPAPLPATISTAVVNTAGLNLRETPDPYNGRILRVISEGEVYQIVAKSTFIPRWYKLLMPSGTVGWVNGRYTNASNTQLVSFEDVVQPTTAYGTVTAYFLNVRSTPNPYIQNILTVIARGETYTVIGKNANSTWWQIRLPDGLTGWVNGHYLSVVNGQNVPVTG